MSEPKVLQRESQNTLEVVFPKPKNSTLSSLAIGFLSFLVGGEIDRFLLANREEVLDLRDPWLVNMATIPSSRSDIGLMNVGDSLPTFPTSGDTG